MTVSGKNVQIEKTSEQGRNRRTFIKKASAGIVLTSLPAQSVWGATCTVSGAMSGNLSGVERHSECDLPSTQGQDASWWNSIRSGELQSVVGVFTQVVAANTGNVADDAAADAAASFCYIQQIQSVIDTAVMGLNTNLYTGNEAAIKVAIQTSGTAVSKLAAVWLNDYFGFDGASNNVAAANARVNQILAYIAIQENANMAPSMGTVFALDGGTTNYFVDSTCVPS